MFGFHSYVICNCGRLHEMRSKHLGLSFLEVKGNFDLVSSGS